MSGKVTSAGFSGFGNGFILILVLFILLVIVGCICFSGFAY